MPGDDAWVNSFPADKMLGAGMFAPPRWIGAKPVVYIRPMPSTMTMLRYVCIATLLACGEKQADPTPGACGFENAAAQAYQGVAPGLKMCLPGRTASSCTEGELRSAVSNMPTRDHAFTAEKLCEEVGYERCDTPLLGVSHYKPCSGAVTGPASAGNVASPALKLPPAEPGPAYIALKDGVAQVLPDGTVQDVAGIDQATTVLHVGADGNVYAASTDTYKLTVWKLDGAKATKLGTVPPDRETGLAVAADGTLYIASGSEVYRLRAKKSEKLPPGPQLVDELAVDADGHLVASASRELWLFADDAWKRVEIPGMSPLGHVWLLGTGAGLVIAAAGQPLATLKDGALAPAYGGASTGNARPVRGPTGVIAVVEGARSSWRLIMPDGTSALADGAAELRTTPAFDGAGRMWFALDGALSIVPTSGGSSATYPMGSLPLLGRINTVTDERTLVVLGSGPAQLPRSGTVQVVDRVTAIVHVNGEPLANADIEVCTSVTAMFKVSPCEDDTSRHAARTSGGGEVSFEKLAVGEYTLVFLANGHWTHAGTRFKLESGASGDLGTLQFIVAR